VDQFLLTNKKVLVTGASSGIGKEIAISISNSGAMPFITGRNEKGLIETYNCLKDPARPKYFLCDLRNEDEVIRMVHQIEDLDGVVFNAGMIDYLPIKFLSSKHLHEIFEINFHAQVLLTQKLLCKRKLNNKASIIYISSISSHMGVPGTAIYAASKAALSTFSKILASELAGKKIRSNVITPGLVRTSLFDSVSEKLTNDQLNKQEAEYPLGFGSSEDVANAAIYLLSDASKWVTGTELLLDGGFTLK